MIDSFTIIPSGDFSRAEALIKEHAKSGATIMMTKRNGDDVLVFCGDEAARRALTLERAKRIQQLGDAAGDVEWELASLRICAEDGVVHVDTLGYEGSAEGLKTFVVWLLAEFAPCTVYEDQTGDDISHFAQRRPSRLFVDVRGEETEAFPRREVFSGPKLEPAKPAFEPLSEVRFVPMPGVRTRR
jgi:hypothetical protein